LEFFLTLSYLLPNEVLDSLILSTSFEEFYSSTLYFDLGNIFDNSFLSVGILMVLSKFCVVLLFLNGSLRLDFGG
jgi:hypothetical protein